MTFFESHLSCQGKKYYTFHYKNIEELLRNSSKYRIGEYHNKYTFLYKNILELLFQRLFVQSHSQTAITI
ncbi:MAG: hypothetical protein HZB65_03545 [Candidatus Aenigmarchaeota archaeon]|nr:hypothetical protein [Candidatus Aenigmarchaeota archaeon]